MTALYFRIIINNNCVIYPKTIFLHLLLWILRPTPPGWRYSCTCFLPLCMGHPDREDSQGRREHNIVGWAVPLVNGTGNEGHQPVRGSRCWDVVATCPSCSRTACIFGGRWAVLWGDRHQTVVALVEGSNPGPHPPTSQGGLASVL